MSKPNILFAVKEEFYTTCFSEVDLSRIRTLGNIIDAPIPKEVTRDFLLKYTPGADIVITSWGTPPLDADVLAVAPRVKLVCHAAGSVRPVVSDTLWERGIRVTSSAAAIAYGVAEYCLGLLLLASKRTFWLANGTRQGYWMEPAKSYGGAFEIYQQNIGIIGAGHIGRRLIQLLKAFTCNLFVYDPYLTTEEAGKLGVTKVDDLETLFATCRAVSLNAPTNEGTRHMLRGHHFARFQPGSLFINTAGSIQIHEEEFIAELRKGYFVACIDRCEREPVELDHPYRQLNNVLLSPHIAGVIAENRLRIGTFVANEIESYLRDGSLIHEITLEALARMA